MIHPNVPQGHAPVPHTFSYYPESSSNQLYAEDIPGSQSIEVVNNSDNFVILAFRKVQNVGFVQNNYDMIVPPWKGLVRPCTAAELTTVVMGQGNVQGLLNKVLVKAYPFSQSSSELTLPNNSGGLPIYAPPGGLPIIGTVNVGNTPNVAVPGGVGITGTPNVAVPGGVGITGTPNVAVPGGVGITGTPNVAVPGGVDVNNGPAGGLPVKPTGATLPISGNVGAASDLPVKNATGTIIQSGHKIEAIAGAPFAANSSTVEHSILPAPGYLIPPAGANGISFVWPAYGNTCRIRIVGTWGGETLFDATIPGAGGIVVAGLPTSGIEGISIYCTSNVTASGQLLHAAWKYDITSVVPLNFGNQPLSIVPATGSQLSTVPGTSPTSSQLSTFITVYTIASLSTGNAPFSTLSSIKWDAFLDNTATNSIYCRYIVGLRGQPSTKIIWYGISAIRCDAAPSGGHNQGVDKGSHDFVYPRGFSVIFPGDITYDVVYGWFNNSPSINVLLEKV